VFGEGPGGASVRSGSEKMQQTFNQIKNSCNSQDSVLTVSGGMDQWIKK